MTALRKGRVPGEIWRRVEARPAALGGGRGSLGHCDDRPYRTGPGVKWSIERLVKPAIITVAGYEIGARAIHWGSEAGPRSTATALAWILLSLSQADRLAAFDAIRQAHANGAATVSAGDVSVALTRASLAILSVRHQ